MGFNSALVPSLHFGFLKVSKTALELLCVEFFRLCVDTSPCVRCLSHFEPRDEPSEPHFLRRWI